MLFVKTKLSYSAIHGIGLFADELIKKDSVIWRFTPQLDRVFTEEELQAQNPNDKEFLETYCFKYFGKYYLCVDDARFMNHSSSPNCTDIGVDEIRNNDLGYTMALTDIQPGEELTCDYRNFGGSGEDDAFNLDGIK
jgi:SET domain-containing protein